MAKKKQIILLFFLFFFSIYCSIIIGQSWDEGFHLIQGKITLDYLLSIGKIDTDLYYREYYSAIYWSLQYLLTQIFSSEYQVQSSHIINLIFSLAAIIGIGKLSKKSTGPLQLGVITGFSDTVASNKGLPNPSPCVNET